METINFYSARDDYGEFSNFARYPVYIDGSYWFTTEHYYQAMKFEGTDADWLKQIKKARTPKQAAEMGHSRKKPLRKDWESVKDGIMLKALRAKFTQHGNLRILLLGTGDAKLVEHTKNDSYWGDGGDGTGKNMLGKQLMVVRNELLKLTATVYALGRDNELHDKTMAFDGADLINLAHDHDVMITRRNGGFSLRLDSKGGAFKQR